MSSDGQLAPPGESKHKRIAGGAHAWGCSPLLPPDKHHSSDVVYWRRGGEATVSGQEY